ncbi:NHL repeat-containing protein [Hoeflea sp. TYP-13]|uniref:NHL repeat-containing protein n=1 Tax=Hoeflea sp. TYP-13 TaxID=3230023 RepID=UPI0034C60DD1
MRWFLSLMFAAATGSIALADDGPRPFASFDLAGPSVLNDPHDLAIGPDGRLYVADKFGSRIAVLDADSLELVEVIAAGRLPGVHDVSFGSDGRAAVAVTGLGAVMVFDRLEGSDPKPSAILAAPRTEGAVIHTNGTIYAMASGTGTLVAYKDGTAVAAVQGLFGAHDVAEDRDGNLWVADNFSRRLVKFAPDLTLLQTLDDPKFGFAGPRYLDVDPFGRLVVADQDAHRVLLIDPDGPNGGSLLGVLGSGLPGKGPNLFDDPEGVAIDGNNYYIADSDNNRIVRYTIVVN